MNADRQRVFVGVDGSRAARQAVLWGAVEARLRRGQLLIGHVELTAADSLGAQESRPSGEVLLQTSARSAADMEPEIDVQTVSAIGTSVSTELLRLTETAQVIALGIDLTRTRAAHGMRGPLEDRVAVHANCPVVTVAPGSFIVPGARSQVSVGWTDNRTAQLALHAAAEEAHLRGVALTVVTVPPVMDPQVVGIVEPPDHESPLIDAVGDLEDRYPGLPINISHETGDVTAALGAMAADSELLVLGCHHSTRPWSIRTGPVAEALMRLGHCPVMLVGRRAKQPAGAVAVPADR